MITDIRKETFQYGSDERHQVRVLLFCDPSLCKVNLHNIKLDVYYPPITRAAKAPILFYAYGGGFMTGARTLPPPFDMAYPCVGAFFARQGFITIIPDYRLASPPMSATYPQPAEDIRDAILWVVANSVKLNNPATPGPDVASIFLMGHSAGAVHVGTLLLDPEVLPADSALRVKIKAAILIAGTHNNDDRAGPSTKVYFGDKVETHSVLRLLLNAKSNGITTLPKILLAEGEYEPAILKEIRRDFRAALEAFTGKPVELIIGERHNHISIYTALSSGQGEEWAIETSEWMWANI